MAHDRITRIVDLTMRLCRAVRRDIESNGYSASAAVKAAGVELVQEQLADRDFRTEEFYRQISKYVALHPPEKAHTPRRKKQAVKDAAETFDVCERIVREAMHRYPESRHFTAAKSKNAAV
jgi:hypothetical protein